MVNPVPPMELKVVAVPNPRVRLPFTERPVPLPVTLTLLPLSVTKPGVAPEFTDLASRLSCR